MRTPHLTWIGFILMAQIVPFPRTALADYPVLDAVQGLPEATLITVYPDDKDPHLYYFVPTSIAIYMDAADANRLAFGVQYWGLTGLDPAGSGAAITVTVVPEADSAKIKAVQDSLRKTDPAAKFAFPTLLSSKMEIVLNGAFVPKNQDKTEPIAPGNTVDASQAFSISLSNTGARAFAQGVSANADVLAARYTYRIRGIGKRLRARITVFDRRVYDHFRATASASAWWGLVRSSWTVDWQKLLKEGAITLEILQGGVAESDEYMLEVFKQLVEAKIAGEGMFKPELKPGGVNTDNGSGTMGWGFSASGAWEHLEESDNYVFEIDKQSLEEREFSLGMSFNAVCAKHPTHFVDLTSGGQCVDLGKYKQVVLLQAACLEKKLARLDSLLEKKLITQDVWQAERSKAEDEPCFTGQANQLVGPFVGFASQASPQRRFMLTGKVFEHVEAREAKPK